jgi:hypothetical protein
MNGPSNEGGATMRPDPFGQTTLSRIAHYDPEFSVGQDYVVKFKILLKQIRIA